MRIAAVAILPFLFAATAANAANSMAMMCSDYASEWKAKKSTAMEDMPPSVQAATFFLAGAYLAATKQPIQSYDANDFNAFLSAVANKCDANPKLMIMDVGLKEAATWKGRQQSRYQEVTLIDLKLDISKMSGKSIETEATVQIVGDFGMLHAGMMDANPLFLDYKKIPREQRKKLLEQCSLGCSARIQGKVGSVMFQNGIIADAVLLD
ncbi:MULTISPECIES: hypothetical protein [Rhizobium/Agrobacterium group]|uniref:Uncharacterized protein n=1 Tax=Rhizobium rhizogenes TaxID=359 RepID=A0A546XI97_RHIRH|nr:MULTISPECIES: hypothetical protein [Rhizobium/Agrobacterium group]TRB00471.1 hypothetical protein EXN68_12215 [Rhizobium rhizogenes]